MGEWSGGEQVARLSTRRGSALSGALAVLVAGGALMLRTIVTLMGLCGWSV